MYNAFLTVAALDNSGQNANINITIEIRKDNGDVVQTRVVPTNGMNGDQLKAYAGSLISGLVVRDGFYTTVLQPAASVPGGFLLAQG